ncbi:MAG: ATP-grasp domain-containing protein [Alphaproteobacteria bacterium]|nr:ATP-grasp domain-containing protein [Alphaproteobacteria bacterium]
MAVTGLNATDNPGPGVGVVRALRASPEFDGRIVALAYDALEPGLYARDLVDDAYLVPYPSQGTEALLARLEHVHATVGLDVVIPTLDAELPAFIALQDRLAALGIATFLPTAAQLEVRSKARLVALAAQGGLPVPASRVVNDPAELYAIHQHVPYPLWVKGAYYGAERAWTPDEAVTAWHKVVATWGLPVIVQAHVEGEEIDVNAVGDGRGGLVGAVPMAKTLLTDKGKGWAGIAIQDRQALALAARFAEVTRWRGPFELELVRDRSGGYHLLEVNPRFPAWCFLTAGAGMNLPWAVACLARGAPLPDLSTYTVGTMFVRIALDQITTLDTFRALATEGEWHTTQETP